MNQESLEQIAVNLRLEKALVDATEVLDDIPYAVFKGPILTRQIYGDLSSRISCDNDIWVEPVYGQLALRRLLAAGYRPLAHLDPFTALRQAGQVALWPQGDLSQPSLDFHVYPFSRRIFQVDEELIKRHLVVSRLHGNQVRHFDSVLGLTHLCAHAAQHFFPDEKKKEVRDAFQSFSQKGLLINFIGVAQATCGVRLVQIALLWSGISRVNVEQALGPLAFGVLRAHSGLVGKPEVSYICRQLWVFCLTFRFAHLPSLWRAIFPSVEELRARYSTGSWIRLQFHHVFSRFK